MESHQLPQGPPYAPQTALLGGLPTIQLDVPIVAVLLLLYIGAAASHMTILQINRRRHHKFLISGATFGYCMARISANVMRIVWATRPTNVNIAIAANVLAIAGVIILFVINAILAQRIVRAAHPKFGWSKPYKLFYRFIWVAFGLSFALLIAFNVIIFFTLDSNLRRVSRDISIYGSSFVTALAFLPVPSVLAAILLPRSGRVEKFGTGRFRTKVIVLLFSSCILTIGAGFRLGTAAMDPRPATDPAWYHSKACFYIFNFGIELIVAYLYLIVRVDKRFYIPDGSSGPGDYSGTSHPAKATGLSVFSSSEEVEIGNAPIPPEELQDRRARGTSFA